MDFRCPAATTLANRLCPLFWGAPVPSG
jgi:hypothetical protein